MGPPKPERSLRRRRVVRGALQLLLTVAVTAFILERVGLGVAELRELDLGAWRPRWGVLVLACGLLLAGYLASAAVWGRIVVDLGGPRLRPMDAFRVYLVANLGRYVPGKVWQIAGLAVLGLQAGVPASISTAAAVLGQAVALGGASLVGVLAIGAGAEALDGWALPLLGLLVLMLAVVLVPPLHRRAVALWFRLARHQEPPARTSAGTTLGWLALYTLNWLLYAAAFVALAKSFDLPGSPVQIGSAFAAAWVLGYAALFAPAGIGVREGFLVVFLSPAMGAGPAGALAVLARVWTTAVELLPAAVLWALHVARPGAAPAPVRGRGDGPASGREPHPPGAP